MALVRACVRARVRACLSPSQLSLRSFAIFFFRQLHLRLPASDRRASRGHYLNEEGLL